jgi:hypothetical protein
MAGAGYRMSRELWQAVLVRTVMDAVLGVANESSRAVSVRLCEEARRYLTRPSRDLAQVCALADMDMDSVLDRMRKQIANALTPEELADHRGQHIATLPKTPKKPK